MGLAGALISLLFSANTEWEIAGWANSNLLGIAASALVYALSSWIGPKAESAS